MKWRHQEEAKTTTSDRDNDMRVVVTCTTSASDVTDDVIDDDVNSADRSMRTGSECVVPAASSNSRKPIMSVADILDLRVAAETPFSDDVTSGQNGGDSIRL